MDRARRNIDEIAALQNDFFTIAAVAFGVPALDLAVEDVPADIVLGVIMCRVRSRAWHENGAAHRGVRDIAYRFVADAEPDAKGRLISCIRPDLLLADDRQQLFFQWMHCFPYLCGGLRWSPPCTASLLKRFDVRDPCDVCKRAQVCRTDKPQAKAAERAIPSRECAIFGDPLIVKTLRRKIENDDDVGR